jgi:methionine-rich copper-binding protein CopC
MRRAISVASMGACALTWASLAFAHAFLDHATPAVGSTVRAPPQRVTLWFTQPLEPAFSTLRVEDRDNRRQDNGNASVDPKDPTALFVSVPALAPGRYRVIWRVLSVDTHVTEGDFTFDIAP